MKTIRWVLYTLDEADVEKINAWRSNFAAFHALYDTHKHPHKPGSPGSTGHVAHTGVGVGVGECLPALVTDDTGGSLLGLKVMLNGNDTYWATGVRQGDGPGCWRDPAD